MTNHVFGLLGGSLADVPIPDRAASINEESGRPSTNAVPLPDGMIVVLDYDEFDPDLLCGGDNAVDGSFPEELRRMDTDNGRPRRLIPLMPVPQLRDHVLAIDSPVRPEIDEHNPPVEGFKAHGFAVDPGFTRDLGRLRSDCRDLTRRDISDHDGNSQKEAGHAPVDHPISFRTSGLHSSSGPRKE